MARRILQFVCGTKAEKNIGLEQGEPGFAICSDKGFYIGVDGTAANEIRFPNQTDVQNMVAAKEALIKNAAAKTSLVDADTIPIVDSAASSATKRITWANIKTLLNALYVPLTRTVNGKSLSANITLAAADVNAAATTHNQDASTITTGILPVARGGTGNATGAPAAHNQGASTITAGTFPAGNFIVGNDTAYSTAKLRNIYAGTTDIGVGTTLANGAIYFVYE